MMSKDNRPRSWKEMRAYRVSQNSFIGREDQIKAFRDILNTPYNRDKVIFNISGQGGIGKTTLLKQFRRIAEDFKQLTAYVDEGAQSNRVDDVPEALNRLAKDFEKQGQKFDKFQERYKTYRQKRQELEADPDAPQGFVAGLGRMLAKASLGAVKSVPGSHAMLDLVETDLVADKAGEYMAFIARKLTNKDEVQLLQEPLEVLTPLFLEDLNRIAQKQTVVLMLDTYEQTGSFLDDWLRSLLNDRYGDLTPNFLLAIAGRDSLSRNIWAEMENWIIRSELEPFTQDETQQYLTNKGITNDSVIQEIWRLSSGGLPLLIGMMAQAIPTSIDVVVDPCEEAVERFLKWEMDATKRQLALNAALPRMLNRDILALLVDESAVNDLFEWLKERSFVVEHPEGWQYHKIVRDQMLRYQRRISPNEWKALHTKLVKYYDGLRKELELTEVQQPKNETWQKYTLEWLYHSLCATPLQQIEMALNGWLIALDISQEYAQKWAEVMKMSGISTGYEDLKRWSQQLQSGLQGLKENRQDEMVEVLLVLLRKTCLEDNCRAIALAHQGIFSLLSLIHTNNSSQVEYKTGKIYDLNRIIEALNQAISLAPDKGEYFGYRGFAHIFKGKFEEAESDLNKCIQLIEPENIIRDAIEKLFTKENFQTMKNFEKLLNEEDREQFNIFKLDEIKEYFEEKSQKRRREIQRIEKEIQRLQKEIQIKNEKKQRKSAIENEFFQGIRRIIKELDEPRENFLNSIEDILTIEEGLEILTDFVSRITSEINKLKEEIQRKKSEPQEREEEIYNLEEELQRKNRDLQKVAGETTRLLKEFEEKNEKI